MNRIKLQDSTITCKIAKSRSNIDLTPINVRILQLKEGECWPSGLTNDPSIDTIICSRCSRGDNSDVKSITIAKRRVEEPQLRNWLDPRTFLEHLTETTRWDISFTYKGKTNTCTTDFPTAPIETIGKTLEQKKDEMYHGLKDTINDRK